MKFEQYLTEAKLKWTSSKDMGKTFWDSNEINGTSYSIIKHSNNYYNVRKTSKTDFDKLIGEPNNLKDAKKIAQDDLVK